MEQGTSEWLAARLGKVTASRVADVIAKTKSGYSASRENYAAQLVAERLTNAVQDSFSNAAMEWGTANEPLARTAYECLHDVMVEQVALINHPIIEMSAASPDGLVGDEGLIEIKCPNTATHIAYLKAQKVPEKYKAQMAWQMACTGRAWCDFVSFDPRMPESLRMFLIRYERDEKFIAELEEEVKKFLNEVSATVEELNNLEQSCT